MCFRFVVDHGCVKVMNIIRMTIIEMTDVTGVHRLTFAKCFKFIPPESGSSCKRKYYDLKLALAAIYSNGEIQNAK